MLPFEHTLTPTEDGHYILRFNASLYKESNCLRKVLFRAVEGLTTEGKDFKMEYGTAFHHGLRARYSGAPFAEQCKQVLTHYVTVTVPSTDWRTSAHLLNCYQQYEDFYKGGDMLVPVVKEKTHMLEQTFSIPVYRNSKVEVILCGTIDMLAIYMHQIVVVDHKTTSLTMPDQYLGSYRMSPQLMTYLLACNILFPGMVTGCVINGIFLNRTHKNTFKRSEVITFTASQMKNFERGLMGRIKEIADNLVAPLTDGNVATALDSMLPNYTCCDEKFGQCSFVPVCSCETPEEMAFIKKNTFVRQPYNPLRFQN